jgi:hypothetical protein
MPALTPMGQGKKSPALADSVHGVDEARQMLAVASNA